MATNPLAAINSVALAIGRFPSLDEMLEYALHKVLEVVETEGAGLYLLDEEKGELTLAVHHGLPERAWRDFDHLKLGEGLSGRVALTGEPIVVRNLKDDPRLTRTAARLEGFRAFASLPLRSNFKTYGTLNVYSRQDRVFPEADVQLLQTMASQIGLSVANARLYLELQASERKFRGLVENARDVIYLTDPEGRLVYANPAMERLLGFDPAALCASGASLLSLVHPDDRPRIALLLPSLVNGQVTRALELRMQHADGARILWFSQTSVPLRDESGTPTGLQCMAQDITARRDLQEQMVREQRFGDLGRMAASIAHEIRNPLGAIVNSINVLKRPHNQGVAGQGSAGADPQLLDIVSEEADRLNHIIREFLLFARPPARTTIPCDVVELIDGTVALFRRGGRLRDDTAVVVSCPHDLPAAQVDPNQMRQVLWNLLANAAEAMTGPGAIDVTARASADGGRVIIAITDDGPGIASPTEAWEPFYTTKAQGTGLGLAIVARIVRDHGGDVEVANTPNRGACFSVSVPVSPRMAVMAAGAAAHRM
jgi:two-component system, sporulation sensor kinase E